MPSPIPSPVPHTRRKADKVRLAGWVNVILTAGLVYIAPDVVAAMVAACVWIVLVFAITQAIAWQLDKKAKRLVGR